MAAVGTVYERIDHEIREFVDEQHMFFVATAPREGGHVNLSPKGLDTLRILDDLTVAYLDLTGSGAETAAHLRDDGRITLMFCAFSGRPRIVRLFGRGAVCERGAADFDRLVAHFPVLPGIRSVITVDVDRVADSCGFAVPRYDYVGDRDVLPRQLARRTEAELAAYRDATNATSIDGLPAFGRRADAGEAGSAGR